MKKLTLLLLLGITLLVSGCGDVTITATVPLDEVPSITVLTQSLPDFALLGQGFGVATAHASVDFTDPNGDVNAISITVLDSRGIEVSRTVASLPSLRGITAGTIPFDIDFSTLTIESYTFTAYITDSRGNVSNPVFGSYRIIR